MTTIQGHYTTQEIMDLLHISQQRVSQLAAQRNWRRVQVGRSWLYVKEDVDREAKRRDPG